jgi:hypothetical protein
MKKTGRPTLMTEDLAATIAERIASGETMVSVCNTPGFPSYTTVMRWQAENVTFRDTIARARENGTHVLAEQCLSIADNTSIDPAHKRVMVDTRMKLIGKWNARSYGDRLDVTGNLTVTIAKDDADL